MLDVIRSNKIREALQNMKGNGLNLALMQGIELEDVPLQVSKTLEIDYARDMRLHPDRLVKSYAQKQAKFAVYDWE
jgi:hypothetical protein